MRIARIGGDRLQWRGETLFVHAALAMPHWTTSRHRRTVVLVEGRAYRVAEILPATGGRTVYRLEPDAASLHELPALTVEYDDHYVEERDRHAAAVSAHRRQATAWMLVYPLLGFLPQRTTLWLHERYGFDPLRLSRNAFLLEFLLILVLGTILALSTAGSIFSASRYGELSEIAFLLFWVLAPDAIVRYHNLHVGSLEQFGFYEWLVRRRLHARSTRPSARAPRRFGEPAADPGGRAGLEAERP